MRISVLAAGQVAFAFLACAQPGKNPVVQASLDESSIGREVAIPRHLQDNEEYQIPLGSLIEYGKKLFTASWTIQEGAGRPLTKGTGDPLSDPSRPLVFPRTGNRISGPESNSCAGCHNLPFGIPGGGGDLVANVFVLGQRFDFVTFDPSDHNQTVGSFNESGTAVTLGGVANSRATIGMFGSGYIEMLARQMTADLQKLRDRTPPGGSTALVTKGVDFGAISRSMDGIWDTSRVQGVSTASLASKGADNPPSLVIRPFHQSGTVISLRQFTNNAFNHHHGIQSTERFGNGTDPDGDGFKNELTRADVTAVTIYQAVLAPPGRVIPNHPAIAEAIQTGEQLFREIGCAGCHVPSLPLDNRGWIYTEPNPYNPAGNLRVGEAPVLSVDLSSDDLPGPRLKPQNGVVLVPAFTDLKLHDICSGLDDPNAEPLDLNEVAGSVEFFAGNRKFITKKLWGAANEPPYFHHGKFTTLREAVLAHAGEAQESRAAYSALTPRHQDYVIEFLKSLQVLAPGTQDLVVDANGIAKRAPLVR